MFLANAGVLRTGMFLSLFTRKPVYEYAFFHCAFFHCATTRLGSCTGDLRSCANNVPSMGDPTLF